MFTPFSNIEKSPARQASSLDIGKRLSVISPVFVVHTTAAIGARRYTLSDQKNPQGKANLPGPLPGMGAKPGAAPLPGVGKPGQAPLPGMGKPGGVALPGRGAAVQLPGQARPSAPPEQVLEYALQVDYSDGAAAGMPGATSRVPRMFVLTLAVVGMVFIGFNVGKAWSNRIQLNGSLRDSLIVQYEVDKAAKLFDELDAVIAGAINDAGKWEYDPKHIEYLSANFTVNPIKPQIFTDRSYRNFGKKAATSLSNYNVKWSMMYQAISVHREKTLADEPVLRDFKTKLMGTLAANYGVLFKRSGKDLLANVTYVGKPAEKNGKVSLPVGTSPDPKGDEAREVYAPAPEGDEGALTKEPEKYVVVVAPQAKTGLLAGQGKAQFNAYVVRLEDLKMKAKMMRDEQTSLMRMLAELASQDPAAVAPPDAEAEFKDYVIQDKKAAPAAEAGAAEKAK
jgi:hypothetical protein